MRTLPARLLLVTVAALYAPACGGAIGPKLAQPLDPLSFATSGGLLDASPAFPVAFLPELTLAPQEIELDMGLRPGTLRGADWLGHLAHALNEGVRAVGRYDRRFDPIALQMFTTRMEDGRLRYPADVDRHLVHMAVRRSTARVIRLRLLALRTAPFGGDRAAHIAVEVTGPGYRKQVAAECAGPDWARECFATIGRRILDDGAMWAAVYNTGAVEALRYAVRPSKSRKY